MPCGQWKSLPPLFDLSELGRLGPDMTQQLYERSVSKCNRGFAELSLMGAAHTGIA